MPRPAIDKARPPTGEPTWKTMSPRSAFADSLIEGFAVQDTAPRRARADLAFFVEYVFVDQKGVPLKLQWFHKEMIKNLLFEKRVLTLLPRSWGKSVIGSVAYPCWRLGVNRDLRIIIASNTITQAKWWLSEIENVMLRNEKYQEVFGYLVPRPRTLRWTDVEKRVLGRSHYAMHSSLLATGIGSALLGARADIIIVDDIVGEKEAVSPALRKQASDWLWTTLLNTLEPDGQVVVSGSRWSQDDIYAEIMERWEKLPSEMAIWQKGAFVLPGQYPRDSELYKMEQSGGLDPLAEQELREQAIAEARKAG